MRNNRFLKGNKQPTELLSANNFTLEELKSFMKKNHSDKYNKIFAE